MAYLYEPVSKDVAMQTCMHHHFQEDYPSQNFDDIIATVRWCFGVSAELIYVVIRFGKATDMQCCFFRRFAGNTEEQPLARILAETGSAQQEAKDCELQHKDAIAQFVASL